MSEIVSSKASTSKKGPNGVFQERIDYGEDMVQPDNVEWIGCRREYKKQAGEYEFLRCSYSISFAIEPESETSFAVYKKAMQRAHCYSAEISELLAQATWDDGSGVGRFELHDEPGFRIRGCRVTMAVGGTFSAMRWGGAKYESIKVDVSWSGLLGECSTRESLEEQLNLKLRTTRKRFSFEMENMS